jgi:uncharacterized membrane protein
VWTLLWVIAALWLCAIVAPPVLAAAASHSASAGIFEFFSYTCHQIPERSLHFMGHQLAVCSRCFGVYAGLLAGALTYPLWRRVDSIDPLPRVWLIAAVVPMGIDWALTAFGIWENTHASRFVTGALLGVACAVYIIPAGVEIARYLLPSPATARQS